MAAPLLGIDTAAEQLSEPRARLPRKPDQELGEMFAPLQHMDTIVGLRREHGPRCVYPLTCETRAQITYPQKAKHFECLCCISPSAVRFVTNGWFGDENGEESREVARVDERGHSDAQDPRTCEEENDRDCAYAKAKCGGDVSAGVQARRHFGLTRLEVLSRLVAGMPHGLKSIAQAAAQPHDLLE
jgi:hypothetical protein